LRTVDTSVVRPDSADFTRRALAAAPNAAVVFFGTEERRTAAAAIAAGARGLIRADHTDPVTDGKSDSEIGRDLYVSEDTVKTRARRLFRKLGARDRAHAVASAFRAGLVS
jgi:DNA-binding NarL/FixJ family response regulator